MIPLIVLLVDAGKVLRAFLKLDVRPLKINAPNTHTSKFINISLPPLHKAAAIDM